MAIDAGDVVITFLGDTTQLDQTFASVSGKVKTTNTEAAVSTVELKAAQQALREALAAVTAEGGNTVVNLERLAEAEARVTVAAAEAKSQHAALKNELLEETAASGLLSGITEELGGALTGLLGTFAAVEGIKAFIEHVQKSVLELEILSEKTGINISTLAGIQHVAEETGVSFEAVGNGLVRMERAQVLAIEGNKQYEAAFHRLGISVQELKTLNPEELFFRLADGMANAKTHGEAAASAITILGKGGAALIPVFNQGSDALREMVEQAAKASGVTAEAGQAAKDWEATTANLSAAFRSNLIPIMEALIPVMKVVETVGASVWFVLKEIGVLIGGILMSMYDGVKGAGQILSDVLTQNWAKAVADAKVIGSEFTKNFEFTLGGMKGQYAQTADFLSKTWEERKPFKVAQDDLSDLEKLGKQNTSELIAQAKATSEGVIAEINRRREENSLAYHQGKIDAETWAKADVQATVDARLAHQKFLEDTVRIFRAAGEAQKAATAQKELDNQKIKDATALTKGLDEATVANTKAEQEFQKTTEKTYQQLNKDIAQTTEAVKEMQTHQPFTELIKNTVALNNDLKKLGVEGWGVAATHLDQARKAEERLNAMGIHEGKLWLEVQKAKIKAAIAVAQIEGTSTKKMEQDLQHLEQKLQKFKLVYAELVPSMAEMNEKMLESVAQFSEGLGAAMALAVQGQISAAQAIERSVGELIKQLCDHWAKYFAAKAIADVWANPAMAAAEFAAAAALEMAGSLAGSLGGGGTAGGGGAGSPGAAQIPQGTATQAGGVNTSTQNVPRLALGGLVTGPTLAMVGERPNMRRGEAVIPLDDPRALRSIARAMSSDSGGISNHFNIRGMISTSDLSKVARTITRAAGSGRLRVGVTNSNRITRKT